jgi:hypothetical protein
VNIPCEANSPLLARENSLNGVINYFKKERQSRHFISAPTFKSLIASRSWSLDSWSPCASVRSWVKIRTASFKIVALSVFGGLPGSNAALNSKNLKCSREDYRSFRKNFVAHTVTFIHNHNQPHPASIIKASTHAQSLSIH